MNTKQANAIPMSDVLAAINCLPEKKSNSHHLWFLSPLRNENTASFRVNMRRNSWYDFGENLHGTVIDFVCEYLYRTGEDNTVQDALRWLEHMMLQPAPLLALPNNEPVVEEQSIIVVKVGELREPALLRYLHERGILPPLAKKYLCEALLFNNRTGKQFSTICLKNEDEGFELRSAYFKGCIGKKSISFVRGTKTSMGDIHVFEGFMDFLSAVSYQKNYRFESDAIILNSVHCLPLAMTYIRTCPYNRIRTWLDNDLAGEKATEALRVFAEQEGFLLKTMNKAYVTYKDVNAWHTRMPRP